MRCTAAATIFAVATLATAQSSSWGTPFTVDMASSGSAPALPSSAFGSGFPMLSTSFVTSAASATESASSSAASAKSESGSASGSASGSGSAVTGTTKIPLQTPASKSGSASASASQSQEAVPSGAAGKVGGVKQAVLGGMLVAGGLFVQG